MGEMPVFVKVEDPKEMADLLMDLSKSISDAHETLDKIKSYSAEESDKLNQWKTLFESVDQKIQSVNEILPEPERI